MSIFCKHDYEIFVDLDSCEYRSLVKASVWKQCRKCDKFKAYVHSEVIQIRVEPTPEQMMEQYRKQTKRSDDKAKLRLVQ